MSSMLEQAIVDAAALREAALKNAEQAIIEKYAPQIKEAVDSMIESEVSESRWTRNQLVQHEGKFARVTTESEDGKVGIQYIGEDKTSLVLEADVQEADEALLQEEDAGMDMGMGATASPEPSVLDSIPMAAGVTPGGEINARMSVYEFNPEDFDIDLETLHLSDEEKETLETPEEGGEEDLLAAPEEGGEEDLLAAPEEEATEEPEAETPDTLFEEDLLKEIFDALSEEVVVDMGEDKKGWITTDQGTLKHDQEKQMAKEESDEEENEENEEYKKKIEELDETIQKQKTQTKDLLKIVEELSSSLNETLLSNAKLLYCNKTLSDASLNERQKNKIVEAIAKAKTPDEAKTLQETLKATVGTSKKDGPKSLSESVNRKSNLSGIMPRRKKPAQEYTFAEHMKKLAGIKQNILQEVLKCLLYKNLPKAL